MHYPNIKFIFPDRKEPVFLSMSVPPKDALIKIYHENNMISNYRVEEIIYNFKDWRNGFLIGLGSHTCCIKLKFSHLETNVEFPEEFAEIFKND